MTHHGVVLRAINVVAKRRFAKEAIGAATTAAGFQDVATHINTGNVRVTTRLATRRAVEDRLEEAYLADRGFEVPCIAFEAGHVAAIAARADELAATRPGLDRHYVYLLKEELPPEKVALVEGASNESGRMVVEGRAVHALLGPGYQPGRVDPLNAARHLGVATARNVTVVRAVAQKWCG